MVAASRCTSVAGEHPVEAQSQGVTRFRGIFIGYGSVVTVDVSVLFDDLVRLETELWNRVEDRVQEAHGVPLAWVEIMQVVGSTPACRVRDIARTLAITVGGASKVVDKVETAGLCERQPNPADGRSSLIRLTGAGELLLGRAKQTRGAALADLLDDGVPQAELTRLAVTLHRLRSRLVQPEPGQPSGLR